MSIFFLAGSGSQAPPEKKATGFNSFPLLVIVQTLINVHMLISCQFFSGELRITSRARKNATDFNSFALLVIVRTLINLHMLISCQFFSGELQITSRARKKATDFNSFAPLVIVRTLINAQGPRGNFRSKYYKN